MAEQEELTSFFFWSQPQKAKRGVETPALPPDSHSAARVNLIKSLTRIHPLSVMTLEPVHPAVRATNLVTEDMTRVLSTSCRLCMLGDVVKEINITQIL